MRGRVNVGPPGFVHGEAQGMFHQAACHFVVAHHGGEDRQARRVRRRPTVGPQFVRVQIELRGAGRLPVVTDFAALVQFVQQVVNRIDHQYVPVGVFLPALRVRQLSTIERPAFDRCVAGNGERPRVRFIGVADELHRHGFLVARHDREAHVEVVRQPLAGPDAGDHRLRVGRHRPARNIFMPRVVGGKDLQGGQNLVGLGRIEQYRLIERRQLRLHRVGGHGQRRQQQDGVHRSVSCGRSRYE